MDLITVILIAIGLAMDAFAVSLSAGTMEVIDKRAIFRMGFHFGLFQGLMTFIGWLGGSMIARWIEGIDHWVILFLLLWVGIRMIRSGMDPKRDLQCQNPSRGSLLIVLCLATSLDALAIGISFAMLDGNILTSSLIIGVITLLLSVIGGFTGNDLGVRFGKKMEIIGGLILIGIGFRVLITHLIS